MPELKFLILPVLKFLPLILKTGGCLPANGLHKAGQMLGAHRRKKRHRQDHNHPTGQGRRGKMSVLLFEQISIYNLFLIEP
jgi:hypothetical protein